MQDSLLNDLNDEQIEAVTQTEGQIRLIAGAGTGKTRALTYRFCYLHKVLGIAARSILALTFTNKAANEMKHRVQVQTHSDGIFNILTFHGFCAVFLKRYAIKLGFPENFAIIDRSEQKRMLRNICSELKLKEKQITLKGLLKFVENQKADISYVSKLAKSSSIDLMNSAKESTSPEFKAFYYYLAMQKQAYKLDFDDLINFTLEILNTDKTLCDRISSVFEYILVDEFQDVDGKQYELLKLLCHIHKNLFVVGDPDQTIYTFRGADNKILLNTIKDDFPSIKTLYLLKNYRSQRCILDCAYSVISNNESHLRKKLIAKREDITLLDVIPNMASKYSFANYESIVENDLKDNLYDKGQQLETIKIDPAFKKALDKAMLKHDETCDDATYSQDIALVKEYNESVDLNNLISRNKDTSSTFFHKDLDSYSFDLNNANGSKILLDNTNKNKNTKPVEDIKSLKPYVINCINDSIQSEYICDAILSIKNLDKNASIAILLRTHSLSRPIERALIEKKINYKVISNVKFLDRKEISDTISYLRLFVNLDDDSAFVRVINEPKRGFGRTRLEHLYALSRHNGLSLFQTLINLEDGLIDSDYKDKLLMPSIKEFIKTYRKNKDEILKVKPIHGIDLVLSAFGYEQDLKKHFEDERLASIAYLKQIADDYEKNQGETCNIVDFLSFMALCTTNDEVGGQDVQIMTVHNSKGLEFDYVFIVNLQQGVFPSIRAISPESVAEERRLMYVAMTRAKKQLFMSHVSGLSFIIFKKGEAPSKFLHELKDDTIIKVGPFIDYHQYAAMYESFAPTIQEFFIGDIVSSYVLGQGRIDDIDSKECVYSIYFFKLGKTRSISFNTDLKLVEKRHSAKDIKHNKNDNTKAKVKNNDSLESIFDLIDDSVETNDLIDNKTKDLKKSKDDDDNNGNNFCPC